MVAVRVASFIQSNIAGILDVPDGAEHCNN
jgi:hypothetical protein